MHDWLRYDIIDGGRLPLLCCLIGFLVTFLVTRSAVRFIRSRPDTAGPPRWWQPRNIHIGATHIHHVVFGVVLVLVSGVALVTVAPGGQELPVTLAATGFGIGAALVLDEYALILHLADVYWEEDGRASVDAVFAATAVTGLLVLGFHPLTFMLSFWHDTSSPLIRAGVFTSLVLALPLAVMVLLKGKVWTGLTGMFFFPLLVVGAIRLSRPHAPWARWRYLSRPDHMHRALERERFLRRPVVQGKLWLQDAIAGRPQVPDEVTVNAELDRDVRAAAAPTMPIVIRRVPRPAGGAPGWPAPAPPGWVTPEQHRAAAAPTRPVSLPRNRPPGGYRP